MLQTFADPAEATDDFRLREGVGCNPGIKKPPVTQAAFGIWCNAALA
jgi:hypothetical protein